MGKGLFDDLFDFNGDGELDLGEQITEFLFIDELMNESEDSEDDDDAEDDIY